MSTNKHTPGPWTEHTFADEKFVEIRAGGGCRIVAHVFLDNGNREANARLIAAAPELLEALLAFVATFDGVEVTPGGDVAKARAAIAKATGGAE